MAAPSIAVLCVAFDGNLVCWLPGGCLAPFLGISVMVGSNRIAAWCRRHEDGLGPNPWASEIRDHAPPGIDTRLAGASAFYVPIDAVIVSQPGGRSLGNAKSSR